MFVDYDPKQHAGLTLYAIEDAAPGPQGELPTVYRQVTDAEEIATAAQVPWYYAVQVEEPADAD
jgi:hypothetical protein